MHRQLVLLFLLAALVFTSTAYAEKSAIDVRRLGINKTDDLRELLGLDIYKYAFVSEKNATFDLVLNEYSVAGHDPKELFRHTFTSRDAGDCSLTVSFLKKDNTFGSALLSNTEEVAFRLKAEGSAQGGLATNVRLPLADVKEKTLYIHAKRRPRPKLAKGSALLVLQKNGDTPGELAFPYAELSVVLVKQWSHRDLHLHRQ